MLSSAVSARKQITEAVLQDLMIQMEKQVDKYIVIAPGVMDVWTKCIGGTDGTFRAIME